MWHLGENNGGNNVGVIVMAASNQLMKLSHTMSMAYGIIWRK